MSPYLATADLLRRVKRAEEIFLAMWAVQCLIEESKFFEKLWTDIHHGDPSPAGPGGTGPQ